MKPNLIRIPISHYSKKVAWALQHAGIDFESRDVWFGTMVNFTHVNPASTVPVLEADGTLICGSHNIMDWTAKMAPAAALYPSPEVADHEAWADTVIGPWAQRVAYRTLHKRPWKYGRNPAYWLAGLLGKPVALNILKYYKARRFEAEDAREGADRLTQAADRLRDGQLYLFGAAPTAADFAQAALIEPILRARDTLADHPDRAVLRAHVERVRQKTRFRSKRASNADHARWASLPKLEEEKKE